MRKSLDGFRRAGLMKAFLEVTSRNDLAIRLYRRLGFSKVRTVYKVMKPRTPSPFHHARSDRQHRDDGKPGRLPGANSTGSIGDRSVHPVNHKIFQAFD